MAENASTELNMFVLFCLLLIQVSVAEIIFEERFEGIFYLLYALLLLKFLFQLLTTNEKLVKFGQLLIS